MKTVFPTDTGYSGMFFVGQRKHPTEDRAQRMGVFVLKRFYHTAESSLVLQPRPDPIGIRTTDLMHNTTITEYENELAIFKPITDIIVRRHIAANDTCSVQVSSPGESAQTWLARPPPANLPNEPDGVDTAHHMFGWESRVLQPRLQYAVNAANQPPSSQAPIFNNLFFNSYRRRFAETDYGSTPLTPETEITISRTPQGGSLQQLRFRIGPEAVRARLLLHDGISPDQPRFWCRHAIDDIQLDTLVISPGQHNAYLIWRGTWEFDRYPTDRYRMLEVTAEELSQ